MTDEQAKKILSELEMLRKLKIVEMLSAGFSQSKSANAIGVSQSTISRMLPGGTVKKKDGADA